MKSGVVNKEVWGGKFSHFSIFKILLKIVEIAPKIVSRVFWGVLRRQNILRNHKTSFLDNFRAFLATCTLKRRFSPPKWDFQQYFAAYDKNKRGCDFLVIDESSCGVFYKCFNTPPGLKSVWDTFLGSYGVIFWWKTWLHVTKDDSTFGMVRTLYKGTPEPKGVLFSIQRFKNVIDSTMHCRA